MPVAKLVDLSHHNGTVDFGLLEADGILGVIIKATQGSGYVDPNFEDNYTRAVSVFGESCVQVYHFLDSSDPHDQVVHLTNALASKIPFIWLDYETNPDGATCTLDSAVQVCHEIQGLSGQWTGMYGSDLLESALDLGHFNVCPIWGARYGDTPPRFAYDIWQFSESGEIGGLTGVDLNCFAPNRSIEWFSSL